MSPGVVRHGALGPCLWVCGPRGPGPAGRNWSRTYHPKISIRWPRWFVILPQLRPGLRETGLLACGEGCRRPTAREGPAATCNSPRASTRSSVAQRCLHGSPCGLKYGHEHEASSLDPRSRSRTRYFAVPRTRATTSPGRAAITVTRPLTKYDWPRERTASLKFRASFWAIPIMFSRSGRTLQSVWLEAFAEWAGTTPAIANRKLHA